MKHIVAWTDNAMSDFMEIWTSSMDRPAVTAAARYLDQILEVEPLHERHEVVRGFGTAIHAPLGVDFWVDDVARRVFVTAAWPVSEDE